MCQSIQSRRSPSNRQDVYLSLGSNIDAPNNLRGCVQALRDAFGGLVLSPVYQTPAVGFDGEDFLNLAAHVSTASTLQAIRPVLHNIEKQHGRQRQQQRFAARTLDIDILLYADVVCDQAGLQLPRSEIIEYAFVLAPLADIAADVIHPQCAQPIGTLWQQFCRKNPQEVGSIRQIPLSF